MRFTLTIDCDNAAFYPFVPPEDGGNPLGEDSELQRLVRKVADQIGDGGTWCEDVRDINGNPVGAWQLAGEIVLPAFPAEGVCTKCGGDVRYCEDVPSVRSIDIDDDGTVWVSGYAREIDEAATGATFECSLCLAEYAAPESWDWGS